MIYSFLKRVRIMAFKWNVVASNSQFGKCELTDLILRNVECLDTEGEGNEYRTILTVLLAMKGMKNRFREGRIFFFSQTFLVHDHNNNKNMFVLAHAQVNQFTLLRDNNKNYRHR